MRTDKRKEIHCPILMKWENWLNKHSWLIYAGLVLVGLILYQHIGVTKVAEKPKLSIKRAIKRPGALTKKVGGKPSKNIKKVRQIAKTGTPTEKKQANFFLRTLRPIIKSNKKT
ncbi:hypothetical protein N9937_02385 [bacterium]|nr:hypothetical protein [bacterium]